MSRLEIFKKMMSKAKANGYKGNDYDYQHGFILDGTNIYSLIFREDFAKAIWGEETRSIISELTDEEIKNNSMFNGAILFWSNYKKHLIKLSMTDDKWNYLEKNINFND